MKIKLTKFISAVALSTVLLTGCATAPKGAMAKIGKSYITEEQINTEYTKLAANFTEEQKKTYDESTDEGKSNILNLKENILGSLVNAEIVKSKLSNIVESYKKDGKSEEEIAKVTVSDEEVNEQITKIKERLGGDEKFVKALEERKITEDELKGQLKDNLYSQKFQAWFSENFKPTEEEVIAKYKGSKLEGPEVTASHILVEKEEEAVKVKERLDAGEEFETVAKEVSKDKGSGEKGGALGSFAKGVMVEAFYNAAINLEIGKISEPVKSDFGYHIIKVTAKVDDFEKFSENSKTSIKANLERQILNSKFAEEFEKIKKEVGYLPIKSFKNAEK